ncbi:CotS family spore coat protein [Paenibacillus sp. KN14-4R]|uniref:CotS family spore coat protein n=1 Tax=Paenibacillus sp. KN14-4R TaxID=3445773 RepID=UPI003FA09A93
MEKYQIVPWIDDVLSPGIVAEQYVPPELEMLAREVMTHYDMQVYEMLLITSKPDKGGAIWKIGTDKGNLSIKCLHRRPRRSLFSVGAQEYMSKLGYRVPSFIPTKEGNLSIEAGGKLWIVTDWIEPLVPVSKIDLEGASQLCFGLGEFHKNSKGYVPPRGSEKSSRIYGWGKYYEKIIAKIGWFEDLALAYSETAASASLLAVIDEFKRQANDIYQRFQNSPYPRMIAKGEAHWGLAHQDFGWSNGQMGPGGIWVIDLDGVAYDLPIRDLRKLITSTMDDMGVWDLTWIRGMIDAYHQANPIDQETFEILWIDMAFPNEFYKHVKEIVFNPLEFLETDLAAILQRVLTTEPSKWQALSELEKDKMNYPAGDYSTETVEPEIIWRPAVVLPGDLWTPIYSDAPPSDRISVPSEFISSPPAPTIPIMPAFQLPMAADSGPTLIQLPTVRRKKITLPLPKRRTAKKTKIVKKVRDIKRKKQKKLTKWKSGSRVKIIGGFRKSPAKRKVKPLLRPKKKQVKKKLGLKKPIKHVTKPIKQVAKPIRKKPQLAQRSKKVAPPLLKKGRINQVRGLPEKGSW